MPFSFRPTENSEDMGTNWTPAERAGSTYSKQTGL